MSEAALEIPQGPAARAIRNSIVSSNALKRTAYLISRDAYENALIRFKEFKYHTFDINLSIILEISAKKYTKRMVFKIVNNKLSGYMKLLNNVASKNNTKNRVFNKKFIENIKRENESDAYKNGFRTALISFIAAYAYIVASINLPENKKSYISPIKLNKALNEAYNTAFSFTEENIRLQEVFDSAYSAAFSVLDSEAAEEEEIKNKVTNVNKAEKQVAMKALANIHQKSNLGQLSSLNQSEKLKVNKSNESSEIEFQEMLAKFTAAQLGKMKRFNFVEEPKSNAATEGEVKEFINRFGAQGTAASSSNAAPSRAPIPALIQRMQYETALDVMYEERKAAAQRAAAAAAAAASPSNAAPSRAPIQKPNPPPIKRRLEGEEKKFNFAAARVETNKLGGYTTRRKRIRKISSNKKTYKRRKQRKQHKHHTRKR